MSSIGAQIGEGLAHGADGVLELVAALHGGRGSATADVGRAEQLVQGLDVPVVPGGPPGGADPGGAVGAGGAIKSVGHDGSLSQLLYGRGP
jgi:hypothetical protein